MFTSAQVTGYLAALSAQVHSRLTMLTFMLLTSLLQVKGLAFNQLSPNLLASGGADGDIIIWDVANPKKPTAFPPLKASLSGHLFVNKARYCTTL